MVCDQGNKKSFDDIKRHWLPEVKNNADHDVEKVLLLNKMDLPAKDLDPEEVNRFASQEGIMVYETSAKTGKNVNGVFVELCRKLIAKAHDVHRKKNRNMTTDKSLFKSSQYEQDGGTKLTAAQQQPSESGEQSMKCCGGGGA